jgi:HAD superfamily hydrolase (TIGR01484 family)
MKTLITFDLDGTLAPSKAAPDAEMIALLVSLLAVARVAIISGADYAQFEHQLLAHLPADTDLRKLSLLPTCGTRFYRFTGTWDKLYSEDLSEAQKQTIVGALTRAVAEAGFATERTWGATIEDRESQITYSALGQQAPLDAKASWDPDFAKRKAIKTIVDPLLSDFSVRLGGATSIDVTLPGIDKAYGMRKLRDTLGISFHDMLYVGDALFPGGNDYPVRETGVTCIQVRDPNETKRVIEAIVACYAP